MAQNTNSGGTTLVDGTKRSIKFKPDPITITVLGGAISAVWVTYKGTEITSGTITIYAGDSVTVSCISTGGRLSYIYLNGTVVYSDTIIDYEYTPSENASSISIEFKQSFSSGWIRSATIIEE